MINILNSLFDPSKRAIKNIEPIVKRIDNLETEYEKLSTEELKSQIQNIRSDIKKLVDEIPTKYKNSLKAETKDSDYVRKEEKLKTELFKRLPEVYASIREITKRKVNKRHFNVQMIAASILAQGYKLTELKTGEGKTMVFQLPAALYGLTGRGSHVVTVNDYLARRDGEYAGHILSELGITVGIVTPQQSYKFITNEEVKVYKGEEAYEEVKKQKVSNPGDCNGLNLQNCTKKEAYDCDVVYGTNNEFGFDYLRDNMITSLRNIAQRELYFCIVDEADSILIDEARTPLIISAPAEQSNDLYVKFARLVPQLKKEEDYTVDEKSHSVALTDVGAEKMEKLLGVKNIWQDYRLAHHLENSLKAQELYKKDVQYLVRNGEVMIVDDFTGRVLEGRRYSEGLHQAIEAKEKVEIKRESKTLGTITFQNFFRLYKILSGGSGTVMTESEEFYKIYNLESIEVPTNKPVIRQDLNDRVYKNREAKFNAVAADVIETHETGRPILIGTTSIEDSEYVSHVLTQKGIEHEVLNAKYHEKESKIVANAGKKSAITVATNMAGRGTDIKLGGKNATDVEFEEIINLGGLYIIGTQRHESRRIDNQLRGRSGRQGEPGTTRFYVALDDEIMRIQGGEIVQRIMSFTKIPDDMPIEAGLIGRSIETAQKRMEGMHFDSRKSVVEYDDVVNQQREIFYSRRRRILEEIEAANVKGDQTEDERKEALKKLAEELKSKFDNEVERIASLANAQDKNTTENLDNIVNEFLDLANDDFIADSIKKIDNENVNVKNIKEWLLEKLKAQSDFNSIRNELKSLADSMFNTKIQEFANELPEVARFLVLRTMDELWTEHLDAMKALRDGIGLRGLAQQDPLVEYKNEGFNIFDHFINSIDTNIARRILKIQRVITPANQPETEQMQTNEAEVKDITTGSHEIMPNNLQGSRRRQQANNQINQTASQFKNVKRNDPCPCGSGLKFKKCGMINSPEHMTNMQKLIK